MMGMGWDGFQLQKLLTETAQQPDIVYLLVTDHRGTIFAHNDTARIGGKHGKRLDLNLISNSKKLNWRLLSRPDGKKIFEVVRKFSPTGGFPGFRRGHMMLNRLFQQRFNQWKIDEFVDLIIFVGLDMRSVEEARRTDTRHTVIMTSILLLVGFAGIILLFLAQGYRSTKASLSRIKAFSGNLVETMPIGLLATDNDDRIASLNQVACHILNLSSENAIGKDAKKILPAQLWAQLKGIGVDKRVVGREIDCSMNDGRVVPLEVSASFFKDEAGTVLGLVTLFKDLTEVRLLKQEVVRSQRLATVGRLAAGIAHEIRNPLSSIKGFAT
jgi:two-component system sensor histidine kinase HydH